jgi:hypothetical protein
MASNLALSLGDLRVTKNSGGSSHRVIRATESKAAGKWYWEIRLVAGSVDSRSFAAILKAAGSLTNNPGFTSNGYEYNGINGLIYHNNSSIRSASSYAVDVTVGIALNLDDGELRFYRENTAQTTVITGLSATDWFACVGLYDQGTVVDFMPAANLQKYAPPAGFSPLSDDIDVGVFWNPADKHANIEIIGLLKTALCTSSSAFRLVRATLARSSGKYYFEVRMVGSGAGDTMIGVATSALGTSNYPGSSSTSWGFYQLNGNKYHNGSGASYGTGWSTAGEVIGVAVDFTAGKIWFSKNGTFQASGNPAAGTGEAFTSVAGTLFPALAAYDNGRKFEGRFKASELAYSPPSGFSAWDS